MMMILNEHADPVMDNQTYNDIIHGRLSLEREIETGSFDDVPISVGKSKWEHIQTDQGEVLYRSLKFLNFQTLFYFIAESLKLQEATNHHCVMTIDELNVDLKLQTKSVQEVTELDLELSEKLNDIYQDTQYFHSVGR